MADPVPGLEPSGRAITLSVKLFAGLREQAGWGERTVTMAAGPLAPTPQRLWQILQSGKGFDQQAATLVGVAPKSVLSNSVGLQAALPDCPLPESVRVAVNQSFAEGDQPLIDGDEVAYLPAISGG